MTLTTEATTTIIPLPVPDELATAEAVDVTLIGEAMETIDIGPFAGIYFRVSAPDLVEAIDDFRRVLVDAEEAVLDARQDRRDAQRRQCPGCDTLIEPDEAHCGFSSCRARAIAEQRAAV